MQSAIATNFRLKPRKPLHPHGPKPGDFTGYSVTRHYQAAAACSYSATRRSEMAQTMDPHDVIEAAGGARVIADRYELHSQFPHSGMSLVFRGWDRELRRPVAVKTIQLASESAAPLAAPYASQPWWREAWIMAAVRHPHIVSVYEAFKERSHGYIVMELMPGNNLKSYLEQSGPLSCEEALTITIQICQALQALHAHGFVHCDIKPHNILRSPSGWVKLADFGIAQENRRSGAATGAPNFEHGANTGSSRSIVGTPTYCSPEQAFGEPLTAATDMYSLGVTLYELLTGVPPFDSREPLMVATQHALAEPPRLRRIRPDAPPMVEKLILQAMSKRPERRFASAQAMEIALEYARMGTVHASAWRMPGYLPYKDGAALATDGADERMGAAPLAPAIRRLRPLAGLSGENGLRRAVRPGGAGNAENKMRKRCKRLWNSAATAATAPTIIAPAPGAQSSSIEDPVTILAWNICLGLCAAAAFVLFALLLWILQSLAP